MSKENKSNNQTTSPQRGLRLIKGASTVLTLNEHKNLSQNPSNNKTKPQNPLIRQLSALSDALDAEVALLLNL